MAVIVVICSEGERIKKQISATPLVLGRSSSCGVKLVDSKVSGKHLTIQIGKDGVTLFKDLGTTNGTFLNGSNIEEGFLYINDEIAIGEVRISINPNELTAKEKLLHTRPIEKTQHTFVSLPIDEKTAVRNAMNKAKESKRGKVEKAASESRQQEIIRLLQEEGSSEDDYDSDEKSVSKPGLKTRVINNVNKVKRPESEHIGEVRDGQNFDLEESSGETQLLKISRVPAKKKKSKL
ncbi:MAG: pSer/pThr/pTyr-binding forkhead associated (FHA) protein [Bacteriovoracaceae bacterium]|jgi:pSer/pThr/pTyr-binding forkhead associated (FHA) protein